MTNPIDAADIEALRSFAAEHNEIQFAHLCTAALQGEEWAIDRVGDALRTIRETFGGHGHPRASVVRGAQLAVIRATDTTRLDGSTARSLVLP